MSKKFELLIIEDEEDLRDLLVSKCARHGFQVMAVSSCDEAWELLSKPNSIQIVLSDIRMPGRMDGVELLKKIRAQNPTLPHFALMTGHMPITEKNAQELGAKKVYSKPFSIQHMIGEFFEWMGGQQRNHERVPFKGTVKVNTNDKSFITQATNLSLGGIHITAAEDLPENTKVKIEINLEKQTLQFSGEVRWLKTHESKQSKHMGVQWTQVDPASRKLLAGFLEPHE